MTGPARTRAEVQGRSRTLACSIDDAWTGRRPHQSRIRGDLIVPNTGETVPRLSSRLPAL